MTVSPRAGDLCFTRQGDKCACPGQDGKTQENVPMVTGRDEVARGHYGPEPSLSPPRGHKGDSLELREQRAIDGLVMITSSCCVEKSEVQP